MNDKQSHQKQFANNSKKQLKELKFGNKIVLSVPKLDRGPLDSK
jgi:hypothetical protein